MTRRCDWANENPLMKSYHDQEWAAPLYDDQKLFELFVLEGMQAGLSWLTVLKKRDNFREAFAGFDPNSVARFNKAKVSRLLQNKGIIRNRLKVESAVSNAQVMLRVQEEFGSFSDYIWQFVDGKPIHNNWNSMSEIPAQTDQAVTMSKAMKKRGFRFVGPTICYAFMQGIGMVNDHLSHCFRHKEIVDLAKP